MEIYIRTVLAGFYPPPPSPQTAVHFPLSISRVSRDGVLSLNSFRLTTRGGGGGGGGFTPTIDRKLISSRSLQS